MLKVLRDNLKYLSWILWGVILVFIFFVFAEWGGAGRRLQGGQQVALSVGDDVVTFPELDRTYRNLRDTYRSLYGGQIPQELEDQLQLPLQAVQQLVRQRLMVQEARDAGLVVSDEELAEKMLELQVFRDEAGAYVGDDGYRRVVRSLGYPTPRVFEEAFRQELLVEKLLSMMRDTLVIDEAEVEAAYRRENETARLDYLLLPPQRFSDRVEDEDDGLEAWFAANSEKFRLPERRAVRYLFIDPAAIRSDLSVDDAEVESWFRQNAEEYRREERVRLRQILLRTDDGRRTIEQAREELVDLREQLRQGADFAELAGQFSEDPASKDQGGDLGFVARGEILPEVENAAFATTPGEIVGPIETSFGLHLIQVTDRQPGGLPPFEEVREQVRSRMLDERAGELAAAKAQEIASRIADSTDPGAEWPRIAETESGVSFFESTPFARNEPVAGIGPSPQFAAAAFSLEVGESSGAIALSQAWAVLNLTRIEEPRIPDLAEVREQARALYVREQALDLATERLREARESVESGSSLRAVAEDLGVEITSTEPFSRDTGIAPLGPAPDLIEAALASPADSVIGPFETARGAVLAVVTERTEFDPQDYASARTQIETQLRDERASRLLESLLIERQRVAEIDYSPELAAQLENLG